MFPETTEIQATEDLTVHGDQAAASADGLVIDNANDNAEQESGFDIVLNDDESKKKQDPVTKAFFDACLTREKEAKEILATTAGMDQNEDNFMRGFIRAYVEIQTVTFGDVEEKH